MEQQLAQIFPVRVELRPGRGRCLVAARSLPAGSVVLAARPAALVAAQPEVRCGFCFAGSQWAGADGQSRLLRCAACRHAFYCSAACQRGDWQQHRAECAHLRDGALLARLPAADAATLQLLARIVNGKAMRAPAAAARDDSGCYVHAWADVAGMAGEEGARMAAHFSDLVRQGREAGLLAAAAASGGVGVGGDIGGGGGSADDESLVRVLLSFDRNDFGVLDELLSLRASAVCPAAALLNHSCCPNTVLGFTFDEELRLELAAATPGGGGGGRVPCEAVRELEALSPAQRARRTLVFRTTAPVSSGDELTHSYVEQAMLSSSRREYLARVYGFSCDCTACCAADAGSGHEVAMLAPAGGSGAPIRVGVVRAVRAISARGEEEEAIASDFERGLSAAAAADIKLAQSMLAAAAVAGSDPSVLACFEGTAGLGLPLRRPPPAPAEEREVLQRLRSHGYDGADAAVLLREVRVLEAALMLLRRHLHAFHVQVVACVTMLQDRYHLLGDRRLLASSNEHLVASYRHVYGGLAAAATTLGADTCAAAATAAATAAAAEDSGVAPSFAAHPMLSLQLFTLGDVYFELGEAAAAGQLGPQISAEAAAWLATAFVEAADAAGADAAGARARAVTLPVLRRPVPAAMARAWLERATAIFNEVAASLRLTHGAAHSLTTGAEDRLERAREALGAVAI